MKQSIMAKYKLPIIAGAITGFLTGIVMGYLNTNSKIELGEYPATERGEVVDNYFGVEVADPYRWLEDDNSEQTAEWVDAQIEFADAYLAQIPSREAIKERITELWNYPTESAPTKRGDYYYYSYNSGLQNQSIVYRKSSLDGEAEIFLDPNNFSDDGTSSLASMSFSKDGKYCAYGISVAGSDWVQMRVLNAETMELLEDTVDWIKFSSAIWSPDNKGFYYSAYDAPKEGVYSKQNQFHKVYYHAIGTPQSRDRLIYQDMQHPLRYFHASVSEDGKWEFISGSEGTSGNEILYRPTGRGRFRTLLAGFASDYSLVNVKDDFAYILTNDSAENMRLAKINLNRPTTGLVDVIAHNENFPLEGVSKGGGYLFATYLQDATSRVYQYNYDGELVREVELPFIGAAGGFSGKDEDETLYYSMVGYTSPSTIYSYDVKSGASELYRAPEVNFDPTEYVTEQVFYSSPDGTQVPLFISYKKGLKRNGKNPTYLYAYGGFQINLTPRFSTSAIMFMEAGGVYCVANIRGGSEYGEKWHKEGMLENKQNVFDDFIAAAEYLIDEKYTSPEKLAIAGGSNGGLLVGAVMVQRPELFAVALPAVGVLDMLRYHKFTIGWGWAVEYGSSENEEQFEYLYKYSPLHNLKDGVSYPATLVTTADHDDRVVPAHSFKFAAQLQKSHLGDNPVLIRIERNAGHGAGKPTSKRIEEAADIFAFIFQNTGSKYKKSK